jgi:hypothetical protein
VGDLNKKVNIKFTLPCGFRGRSKIDIDHLRLIIFPFKWWISPLREIVLIFTVECSKIKSMSSW